MDREWKRMNKKMPGLGCRVALSVVVGCLWLAFLVLWLFFLADKYSIYQNIAIFLVSVLAVGGILGAAWASWGMKYGGK